jgi:4-diphosphocytidyl-2-C-methyl-D-erythritol kinase
MTERLAPIVRLAPAKLNLTLAVLGRRSDGYHELHSVMVPLELADRLSLAPAAGSDDTLHVVGADTGPPADNLVRRAIAEARASARSALGPAGAAAAGPLAARLEKHIPVAAGLAGGSSDAAAALDAAFEAWSVEVGDEQRHAAAVRLGSDVPFFLAGGPALVEGRGERITPLGHVTGGPPGVLLVTPSVPSRTPEVFAAFDQGGVAAAADPRSTRISSDHLVAELRGGLRAADLVVRGGVLAMANDLAAAAFAVVPGLLPFRRSLARLLRQPVGLSGSGPTLWSLYPSLDEAAAAARLVEGELDREAIQSPGERRPLVIPTRLQAAARTNA